MVDLFFVVVFEFILDREPVWILKSSDYIQEVALKAGEIVHRFDFSSHS